MSNKIIYAEFVSDIKPTHKSDEQQFLIACLCCVLFGGSLGLIISLLYKIL